MSTTYIIKGNAITYIVNIFPRQSSKAWPTFNPLIMNDDYSHHRNLATCYQLAQSVLTIGSVPAERVGQGEVSRCTTLGDNAMRLLQLVIEKAWSALNGPFFRFLVQTSVETVLSPCRDYISGFFQSEGAFSGRRALTTERSVMSG